MPKAQEPDALTVDVDPSKPLIQHEGKVARVTITLLSANRQHETDLVELDIADAIDALRRLDRTNPDAA